jgi:ABC-type multidrug transport system fused ATPase/permease subunit
LLTNQDWMQMLDTVKQSLLLVDVRERYVLAILTALRALLGLFDIAGIFLVGLLLAKGTAQIAITNSQGDEVGFASRIAADFTLIQIASVALILFLSKSIFASLLMRVITIRFAEAESRIVPLVFLRILRSPISKVSKHSQSDYVMSLLHSAGSAISQLLTVILTIFSELTLLIFISITFALVDLKITIYIVVYFLILGILIHKTIGTNLQRAGKRQLVAALSASSTVHDSLGSFREIHTLEKQNDFSIKFGEARSTYARSSASLNFLAQLPRYIVESAVMVGAIGLAGFTLSTGDPASAAGTLGIFLTGGLRIMASMLPLQNSLGSLKQLTAQADLFLGLTKEFPAEINGSEIRFKAKTTQMNLKPIEIVLDQVSYSYENSEFHAVKSVSLKVPSGHTVAFIGASGSGKSTLADLIVGLLAPTSGTVSVENPDFRNVGYVPQSPGMVSGTISENITLDVNKQVIDPERLNNALSLSHLTDLVRNLENGVDTELGAQSDGLSGGQLQRIGLARAIYANPGLLVLDEATSALDAETEAAVSDSLRTLHGTCTTIVIAHRLSTIQNVDKVFVFDKGEVVASGKFSELVTNNEIVARFVELNSLDITD